MRNKYYWRTLEVDGCLVFEAKTQKDRARLYTRAHGYAEKHGLHFQCISLPGIVFVVRVQNDSGSGTVRQSHGELTCQVEADETKSKAWRLYVPSVRPLVRRRRRTLRIAMSRAQLP